MKLMTPFLPFVFIFLIFNLINNSYANTPPIGKTHPDIYIVDQNEQSGFTTIQSAIDATVQDKEVILLIKPGTYREKLFITRNNISLIGSSPENTIISYDILRNNWRNNNPSDWGAAVVNISASDVNIINLSVINDYGRQHQTDDHQFAIRSFENASRIILHNCTVIADGADTVSLWNKKNGMYYHSYCHFEGYTDMVCPRGTALIENSSFYNKKHSATIWHDGQLAQQQKLVINDSKFDGIPGFWLGRHHYDAQFYLINSTFSEHMADKAIFKKTYQDPTRNRPNLWGERYFFYNNQSPQPFPWLANNFNIKDIPKLTNSGLESWVFAEQWFPNNTLQALDNILKDTKMADFNYRSIKVNKH